MAKRMDAGIFLLTVFHVLVLCYGDSTHTSKPYCPFFNNRAPKAQPSLQNCTWFKENSCCMQQEIEVTFGKVKPLQGASVACQKYINYLMCYICAPYQYLFYKRERLTVCGEFCDSLFHACSTAILKGSVIKELYDNGKSFCESRRFEVDTSKDATNCFKFDSKLDTSTSSTLSSNSLLAVLLTMLSVCITAQYMPINTQAEVGETGIIKINKAAKRRKRTVNNVKGGKLSAIFIPRKHPGKLTNRNFALVHPEKTTIFVALLLFLCAPQTMAVESDMVKEWAQIISNDLKEIFNKGSKHKDIQDVYDKAHYTSHKISGDQKMMEIKDKLGKYFTQKHNLASDLATKTSEIYDAWCGSRLASGEAECSLDEHLRLRDLTLDRYRDADFMSHFNSLPMTYDKLLKTNVTYNTSFVKISDEVKRDSVHVVNMVDWSADLDPVFAENHRKDPDVRLQYFGSKESVLRGYPGMPWKTNFIGFTEDFDPRTRPWYLAATAGPKDVVIILDASSSMEAFSRWNKARTVALKILDSLTRFDYVNVIASRTKYWTNNRKLFNYTADTLSCQRNTLVPATAAHRRELVAKIKEIKPDGGSDHYPAFVNAFDLLSMRNDTSCQQIIIFITDGKNTDRKIRCDPGHFKYDDENRRHYKPGEICKYKYSVLLKSVNELQSYEKIPIFTFLTTLEGDHESVQYLPGNLACTSGGAISRIYAEADIMASMAPYYSYIESSAGTSLVEWSEPYLDSTGLGLTMTATKSVYSNITGQHLGVVGIDVSLASIESMLLSERWGHAYAFLVDREANAVIHPFSKPSAKLVDDPGFVNVAELETQNGEPEEFSLVLDAIQNAETGNVTISFNAQRPLSVNNALTWVDTKYTSYFFTPVPGSEFMLILRMDDGDEMVRYVDEPFDLVYTSYLHQMAEYNKTAEMQNLYSFLRPSTEYPRYQGMSVSMTHSVVSLSRMSYCSREDYTQEHRPTVTNLHQLINSMVTTDANTACPNATLKPGVRSDIHLTSKLEPLWMGRDASTADLFIWTFIGTSNGVMRIYPGVELQPDYDPHRRPWYERAIANPGQLALSSVYEDASGQGKVVTLSQAVHQPSSVTPADCSDDLLSAGCACSEHAQCVSGHCRLSRCASDRIEAVSGLDMRFPKFFSRVESLLQQTGYDQPCWSQYRCADNKICITSCYLVDQSGDVVSNAAYLSMLNNQSRSYQGVSLATTEGYIFSELVKEGFFVRNTRTDYQAICSKLEDNKILSISSDEGIPLSSKTEIPVRGPFPAFQTQYGCVSEVVYYTSNLTVLDDYQDGVINGTLDDSPCAEGQYYFTEVPDTNVFLLVIENHQILQNPVDFNCQITKSILQPGSFGISEDVCSRPRTNFVYENYNKTCRASYSVTDCLYSGTSIFPMNGLTLFLLCLISAISINQ